MVPKLIGSKVVRDKLQYIGQTPHKHVHIDMKLNFMHILADLGFGGDYHIYWIKEIKHAIIYTWNNYACSRPTRTNRRYNLDETPSKLRRHTKVWYEKQFSKLYQRPKSTHDLEIPIETKSINKWLIRYQLDKDAKWK